MTAITIPTSLKSSFGVSEPATVCDEQGNVLGYYTPVREATPEDYAWAKEHFTPELIAEARKQEGGYTTAEVLEHLNSLER
jgi:hypothetical protein